MDVAQNLQGFSYEVCFTNMATIFRNWIICYSFRNMHHYNQQLVAMRSYEICLQFDKTSSSFLVWPT